MTDFLKTQQWKSGSAVADFLDAYFAARGWSITPTTPDEERRLCLGDRHFRRGETHWHVEYKSGIQTGYTGNIFLETVSVDTRNKPGWVITCRADLIVYAALLNHKLLIFTPDTLRDALPGLRQQFREVATGNKQNNGYQTHGLIVPLAYAEQHLAERVISLREDLTP